MSYCKKCGKPIADGEELCEECRNHELIFGDDRVDARAENLNGMNDSRTSEKRGDGYNFGNANELHNDFVYANYENERPNNGGAAPGGNSRMTGFAFALISAILGLVSVCCSYLAAFFLIMVPEMMFFSINIVAAMIVSLIFGIKSIKTAVNQKRKCGVMPIPTLVLGISGVALSGISIFIFLLAMTGFILLASI